MVFHLFTGPCYAIGELPAMGYNPTLRHQRFEKAGADMSRLVLMAQCRMRKRNKKDKASGSHFCIHHSAFFN
jgi:hypothetical protein